MNVSQALFAVWSQNAGVTAIIGAAENCRAYPTRAPFAPGEQLAYMVWQVLGSDPKSTHGEPTDIKHQFVQLACFAPTYGEAVTLRDAAVAAIEGIVIAVGMNPTLTDERETYDDVVDLHRADADFMI